MFRVSVMQGVLSSCSVQKRLSMSFGPAMPRGCAVRLRVSSTDGGRKWPLIMIRSLFRSVLGLLAKMANKPAELPEGTRRYFSYLMASGVNISPVLLLTEMSTYIYLYFPGSTEFRVLEMF